MVHRLLTAEAKCFGWHLHVYDAHFRNLSGTFGQSPQRNMNQDQLLRLSRILKIKNNTSNASTKLKFANDPQSANQKLHPLRVVIECSARITSQRSLHNAIVRINAVTKYQMAIGSSAGDEDDPAVLRCGVQAAVCVGANVRVLTGPWVVRCHSIH